MPRLRFKDLYITVVESEGKPLRIIIPHTTPTCGMGLSLKDELGILLAEAEKATQQDRQPQTVQEVEMIEKPLEETLKELQTYKEELRKKPAA